MIVDCYIVLRPIYNIILYYPKIGGETVGELWETRVRQGFQQEKYFPEYLEVF